ncbi:DUF3280 domain-containing protein [Ensifer sp. BR816]|uniref:DUF3280 domain-containing protein n=1 Tax=Rhizobium sp. (strain BR816) TaxID=1057002 RepID=UPI000475B19F|nr:DUF3280 domain-containing protein [Ensifer sp. BR816]
MRRTLVALILALLPALALAALDKPLVPGARVAFLGMTFIDLSTEGNGVRADETERLKLLEGATRDRFAAEGFVILSNDPVAAELAGTVNPAACYGCDVRMAARLGADYVIVGEVRKVSNLVLSINLVLRDVRSGEMLRGLAVDIRSNTNDSWLRGIRYILKNHFFKS